MDSFNAFIDGGFILIRSKWTWVENLLCQLTVRGNIDECTRDVSPIRCSVVFGKFWDSSGLIWALKYIENGQGAIILNCLFDGLRLQLLLLFKNAEEEVNTQYKAEATVTIDAGRRYSDIVEVEESILLFLYSSKWLIDGRMGGWLGGWFICTLLALLGGELGGWPTVYFASTYNIPFNV